MPALVCSHFCGCFDLKTGCFVLGYLNLIGSLFYTVILILLLGGVEMFETLTVYELDRTGSTILLIVVWIVFISTLLDLVFTIGLLYGLRTNKLDYLKAYLIYGLIFLIITIINFIIQIIKVLNSRRYMDTSSYYYYYESRNIEYYQFRDPSPVSPSRWNMAIFIIWNALVLLLEIYFLLLIRSMYYKMQTTPSGTVLRYCGPSPQSAPAVYSDATQSCPPPAYSALAAHSGHAYTNIYPGQELSTPISAPQHHYNIK